VLELLMQRGAHPNAHDGELTRNGPGKLHRAQHVAARLRRAASSACAPWHAACLANAANKTPHHLAATHSKAGHPSPSWRACHRPRSSLTT
jgi:hypothetical protein